MSHCPLCAQECGCPVHDPPDVVKRSGLKQRTPMKKTRRTLSLAEREQALQFHWTALGRPCAVCDRWVVSTMEAHHVVEKQELKRRGLPLYDQRNALPLCGSCHEGHTNASQRVPFRKLRAENVAYAFEVLGEFASDYLGRRYPAGHGDDEEAG